MKKLLVILCILVLSTGSMFGQTAWVIDPTHSKVMFSVSHLVITDATGQFKKFGGTISASKEDFSDLNADVTIDVNSISTDDDRRDGHLKGEDFFDAPKFPTINFKSTSFKKVSGKMYKLAGNFTMKGVTKPIEFDVEYRGTVKDPWGNTKAGFKVKGKINRMDYGIKFNTLTETGGAVVGQEVELIADLELNKQK